MVPARKILTPHLLLALLFLAPTAAGAQTRDVAGAKDFPGIGRFGGSIISGYQVKDFDAARIQAAPFKNDKPADARRLEGRITRIAYRTNPGPSILEVSRNFETQLTKAGFETLLTCDTDACGGIPFTEAIDALLIVAELGAIENKMVDAAAMAKGLGDTGHIALYGIYFDTDKAVIKPESRPTLEQIAKLLAGQPQLNVFIVGHTDSQGTFDYNLDLSRRRAEAIAQELVKSYRIAQPRLRTAGVGLLAPIGSNASEPGRALNRRVELVAP